MTRTIHKIHDSIAYLMHELLRTLCNKLDGVKQRVIMLPSHSNATSQFRKGSLSPNYTTET